MRYKEFLVFVLPIFILTVFFVIPDSYGHGLGYEILPPVDLGSKQVALEISSNMIIAVSYTHLTLPTILLV